MTQLQLQNITKRFGDLTALNDVSLTVNDGEFFVLLGPTGAGKTTTLRVIAGLEKPDEGEILFDGVGINHYTPADRDVAFVFQQYSLYPNMSVYENLSFPLKSPLRRTPAHEIDGRVREVAEILSITHLLDRKTARLSGGEMQRVSIGRAIVRQPRIYLMDEPLSNLDAKLRERLRVELEHIQKAQQSTTIFVTHDQVEALTMADRLAVLDQGAVLQIGTPYDIYDKPATTYVATLVGTPRINLVDAHRENGALQIADSPLHIPAPPKTDLPQEMIVGIRPEDVQIKESGAFEGQVALTETLGVETIVHIRCGEQTLLSIVPGITKIKLHDQLRFDIDGERVHYFNVHGIRV
jgi:multiple sugar transport system ATP-binding protein